MKIRRIFLTLLFMTISSQALSQSDDETASETAAYWDFGVGLGAAYFEQYPAANQYSLLALPAPTFRYRGRILRADEKDGAHIYLLKNSRLSLELSGDGTPALDSDNNRARTGMPDLPWMLALGPKLVLRGFEGSEVSLGLYQMITSDFRTVSMNGLISDLRFSYRWSRKVPAGTWMKDSGRTTGRWSLSFNGGNKASQALYFQVDPAYATPDRRAYDAKAGLLSEAVSYSQSLSSGRVSVFAGATYNRYRDSVNRASPLHKSDHNFLVALGMNYVLGESSRPEVPEEETSGLINSLRQNPHLRNFL